MVTCPLHQPHGHPPSNALAAARLPSVLALPGEPPPRPTPLAPLAAAPASSASDAAPVSAPCAHVLRLPPVQWRASKRGVGGCMGCLGLHGGVPGRVGKPKEGVCTGHRSRLGRTQPGRVCKPKEGICAGHRLRLGRTQVKGWGGHRFKVG